MPRHFHAQVLFTLFLTLVLSACSKETVTDAIIDRTTTTTTTTTIPNAPPANSSDIYLSWTAPSARENNEPMLLSEIAGYRLYYGTAQRNYSSSVYINDGTIDNYTFNNISTGTYYFTLTTYDTDGHESRYSSEIKIVV